MKVAGEAIFSGASLVFVICFCVGEFWMLEMGVVFIGFV